MVPTTQALTVRPEVLFVPLANSIRCVEVAPLGNNWVSYFRITGGRQLIAYGPSREAALAPLLKWCLR